jgi:tetratricopeptide (TPR) repeat protein
VDAALELFITQEGKRYKVTVKSGYGKREGFFKVDPSVKSTIHEIERAIKEQKLLDKEFVEKLGIKLFEMLFSNSKDLLHRCLDEFDHLEIVLNMKDPFLHEIPWELCYDPEYPIHLGADSPCSLVRRDQKSTHLYEKIDYPLKVLVIVSSPMDLEEKGKYPPDPDEIIKLMEPLTSLVDKGMVQLDFLERASVKCIQDKLKEGYHIVHFIGHGVYDREEEKGYLLLEDKNRNTKKLEGRGVAQLFGVNPPQLMILSSCESSPLIPFLLTRKIPAVLAMQYTVLLRVATQFVERFYSLLVKGDSVAQAVSTARSAVLLEEGEGSTGWFTPVLYVRSADVLKINTKSEPVTPKPKVVTRVDMIKDLIGVENFVGRRKDLWLIEKALFEEDLKLVLITGIGGIGKNALASKFVRKHKDRFKAVFVKKIGDPKMGVEEILGLLDHFLMENGDKRLHDVIGKVDLNVKLERLNYCLKDSYLIILDNLELLLKGGKIVDESVEAFLRAVLFGDHSSKIIITSRYPFTFQDEKAGGLIQYVDLKELSSQAAMQLLERLGIEGYMMRKWIHKKIGGNPQFLEFFVNLAKTRSVEGLLRDVTPVREKIGEWLLHELVGLVTEEEYTVLKKMSIFRLKVERSVLGLLGVSGEVMDKLVHYSLVKVEHGYFFMHQGIKMYVQALLSDDEKVKAHKEAAKCYKTLFKMWKGDSPDILEWHYHLVKSGQYEKAGELAIEVVEPFIRQGRWEMLTTLLTKTVNTTEGKTKAAGMHGLGIVFQSLGAYEKAEKLYKESLNIAQSLKDEQGIARSLHHLGMVHQLRGEYEEAEKLYRESLDIVKRLKDEQGIARSLHQLGIIHEEYEEYEEAENLYRESLDIVKRLKDEEGIAASLHQLGWIHQLRGEYEEAKKLYIESLKIEQNLKDVQGIAASLHHLGIIHEEWGAYEKAENMYRESLKIAQHLKDKEGIARSLHQLGIIHQLRGEYEEAENLYRESLKIEQSLKDVQGKATSLHRLGMIHEAQGEYKEAMENYINSLTIFLYVDSINAEIVIKSLQRMRRTIGEEQFNGYWKIITNQEVPEYFTAPYAQLDVFTNCILYILELSGKDISQKIKKLKESLKLLLEKYVK